MRLNHPRWDDKKRIQYFSNNACNFSLPSFRERKIRRASSWSSRYINVIKNINSLLSDISNIINVSNLNYLRNRNPSFPRFSSNPVQEEGEIDHPSTIFILRTVQRCPAPVNPTFARYGRNTLVKSSREQQTCTSSIQGRNVQQETAKRIFFDDSSSFDIVQLKSRKLDSGGWEGGAMAPNDRPLFVVLE